jgi:hypothetical protein
MPDASDLYEVRYIYVVDISEYRLRAMLLFYGQLAWRS